MVSNIFEQTLNKQLPQGRRTNPKQFAKIITISCLVAAVSCANFPRGPYGASSQINPQAVAAPGSSAEAAAKAAAQQAKLHYVEIGPSLKGDYKFGYDTGSGPAGQSFREETRLDDGTVKGAYGYVDANGKQRIVRYTAGKNGFVVEGDQEAQNQAAPQAAGQSHAPEPVRRPQPATIPQHQAHREAAQAQPTFDDGTPVAINRNPAAAQQDRALAEQQHAEQLRQHQLAQQAALAQQQQLAQRLQQQQQQELAAEQARRLQAQQQQQQQQQSQQASQAPQFAPSHPQAPHHHGHQQQAGPVHQHIDPQTGSFFSSSSDPNLHQLLSNQLRQLQSGSQFGGQFVPPQPHHQVPQQFPSGPANFQQPAQQFAAPQQAPQDFSQFRAARQAANLPPFHQAQAQAQSPSQHLPAPQSALLALHQQQQHDAQMLANLRAQQLARAQEQQARQLAHPGQQAPQQIPTATAAATVPEAQHLRAHQHQHAAQSQQFQRVAPQPQQAQPQPSQAAPVTPQPESFGPPVIDIRTLNYSIGQQTRV